MADVSLLIGSETRRFDLALEGGRKLFSTREEPIIPVRALLDVPSYGDLPPEKILAFIQNNWRGGMGQKDRFNIMDMYAEGQSIDTREPNQITLGPLINSGITSITEIIRPNDAGAEENIPTVVGNGEGSHHTVVDEVVADDDTSYVATPTDTTFYRDLYDLGTPIGSGTVEWVEVCIRHRLSGTGINYTYASVRTGGATHDSSLWNVLADEDYADWSHRWTTNPETGIAWTLEDLATLEAGVKMKGNGSASVRCTQVYVKISYTFNDTIILLDFFEEREYAASTRYVYKLSADKGTWVEVLDVGDADTIECIGHYDGYIYIGLTTGKYYYSDTGENEGWTQSTLSDAVMHEICVAPSFTATKDILILAKRPNELRTAIAPLNGEAGWIDPPYYIGDENADITNVFVFNSTLFIGKTDGLYALPTDGRPVLVLSYKEQKNNINFAFQTNWQGISYSSAAGDILEIIGSASSVFSIDYMGPLSRSPELATIGSIKGITSDDKNIYAVFLIGSNYVIYAGRERRDDKFGLRWEWSPFIFLGTNACGAIKVMQRSGDSPLLWFAYGSNMAYAILAKAPNYPLGDSAYRFCSQGFLYTTYFDAGYDTWTKIFYQLWSIVENLTAGITVVVTYQKDAEIGWSTLATITANGVQSVDLASLTCKKVRLKFELNTGTNTVTPILREFIYRGVLQPEVTKTLDFTVILSQSNSRKPASDLAFLEGGRTATAPILLKDLRFGTTKYVTFLPNSPIEIEAIDEASKQPSYQARILAQQLNWTKP